MEQELKELEEERKRKQKEKQLRKIVSQKAAANDNTPTLKETNQLKIQEYRSVSFLLRRDTFGTLNIVILNVGVSRGYTDHYQGRGQAIRPTATLINIHEPLI